jgi:hypothetical protein
VTADRIDAYELTRTLTVWRSTLVDDGQGGSDDTVAQVPGDGGSVRAKVNEPSAAERVEAMRSGAELTFNVHLLPDADVRRGDELRGAGEVFKVKTTILPSVPMYLRAACSRDQYEG